MKHTLPLTSLAPRFIVFEPIPGKTAYRPVDRIEDAEGLRFKCPLCLTSHEILCWSDDAPASAVPRPGRWTLDGSGVGDLTLAEEGRPAVLQGGCGWHGRIEGGEVRTI